MFDLPIFFPHSVVKYITYTNLLDICSFMMVFINKL